MALRQILKVATSAVRVQAQQRGMLTVGESQRSPPFLFLPSSVPFLYLLLIRYASIACHSAPGDACIGYKFATAASLVVPACL